MYKVKFDVAMMENEFNHVVNKLEQLIITGYSTDFVRDIQYLRHMINHFYFCGAISYEMSCAIEDVINAVYDIHFGVIDDDEYNISLLELDRCAPFDIYDIAPQK